MADALQLDEEEPQAPLGQEDPKAKEKSPSDEEDSSDDKIAERAFVKRWQDKIIKAKAKWEPDFERMRDDMDFVSGIQWPGQKTIRCNEYVVNMVLRAVNQGVASLYAKDPKVSAKRRQKLNYRMWDGKVETIQQANQIAQMGQMHGFQVPPDILATIQDYNQGRMREALIDKVCKTLEVVTQYQIDTQHPRFKTQMKQLVRRVRTCGVGYVKVLFNRDGYEEHLTQSQTRECTLDRAKAAKSILEKLEEGKIQETSAEVENLRNLVNSLGGEPLDGESVEVKERITFDFPKATSIIPDPSLRSLKDFVGAHWVVEEFTYPIGFVNSFYGVDIKSSDVPNQMTKKTMVNDPTPNSEGDNQENKLVNVWEVHNLDDKSIFVICEGHKDYVQAPEYKTPTTRGFWNIIPVTFNDIETEDGCKASPFPPSDVDLMMSAQKEWNETRYRLARHRRANAPRYLYAQGSLAQDDLDAIENSEDQQFIPLTGVNPGTDISKVVIPLQTVDIKQELYNTDPLREDTLLATGQQEANIGPAQPNVTATVGTIAEQSRMSVAASDVDGLDDSLTNVFQCVGEMLLREMSADTVRHICGPGAVWPEQDAADFINEIDMEIVAASSGRPNKAIDVANWERLAPLIMQAGGNPQAVIRETIKRIDDNLEPSEFMLPPVHAPLQQPNQEEPSPANGNTKQRKSSASRPKGAQPLQPSQSGVAVPLAGH